MRRTGGPAAYMRRAWGWLEWLLLTGAVVACAAGISTADATWLLALGLAVALVMAFAAKSRGRSLRIWWYALACAAALFTIADYLAIRGHVFSRVFTGFYLPGYLLTALSFWRVIATGPARRRGVADLMVLGAGVVLLLMRLVFAGGVRTEEWDGALRNLLPLADLMLLILAVAALGVRKIASTALLTAGVAFLFAISIVASQAGYTRLSSAVMVLQTGFLICWALAPMTPPVRPTGAGSFRSVTAGLAVWPLLVLVLLAPVALLAHGSFVGDGRSVAIAAVCGVTAVFVLVRLSMEGKIGLAHDPITGVASLQGLYDSVVRAFADDEGRTISVYFFDVVSFHMINDMHGTASGDQILSDLAERATDMAGPKGTAARLNADCFAVLMLVDDQSLVDERASRLQASIARPVTIDDRSISLTSYVGYTTNRYANDADELLRNADLALHAAKTFGAGRIVRYGPTLLSDLVEPTRLRGELPGAIGAGQLFLEYQPIVELATDRIEGYEALVRWQHPELGRLSPDRFITVAENAGCIHELGAEVLRQALHGTARLNQAAGRPIFVDINVSPHQLADADTLIAALEAGLTEARVDPALVVLELTETGLGESTSLVEAVLSRLHQTGVRLAVDDFGTGYSSLSRIRELPIHTVKVDKSFLTDLCVGPPLDLIKGIIDIAESMDLAVVVEGVETIDIKDLLVSVGCKYGQGYYFSRPVALETAVGQLQP